MEDLRGDLVEEPTSYPLIVDDDTDKLLRTGSNGSECRTSSSGSCGRPGGCCRDSSRSSSKSSVDELSSSSHPSSITLATSVSSSGKVPLPKDFAPYDPTSELIFPPALWEYQQQPICYGDGRKIWFKPTSLEQLLELKDAWPSAKIIGGASETQVRLPFSILFLGT